MSKLNNPAGRLHNLLQEFSAAAADTKSINATWAEVLGVAQADLLPLLGETAGLLNEVGVAVQRSGRPELIDTLQQFSGAWAVPLFTHGRNPSGSGSSGLVDRSALVALGTLAMVLELVAPDGRTPEEADLDAIRDGLNEVLEELLEKKGISATLAAAINARVRDILWAIDHVDLVGPDGVQAAVERLVGQLNIFTVNEPEARKSGVFMKAMQVAAKTWTVFRTPGDTQQALEGWKPILEIMQ